MSALISEARPSRERALIDRAPSRPGPGVARRRDPPPAPGPYLWQPEVRTARRRPYRRPISLTARFSLEASCAVSQVNGRRDAPEQCDQNWTGRGSLRDRACACARVQSPQEVTWNHVTRRGCAPRIRCSSTRSTRLPHFIVGFIMCSAHRDRLSIAVCDRHRPQKTAHDNSNYFMREPRNTTTHVNNWMPNLLFHKST